jgi:WLM domain
MNPTISVSFRGMVVQIPLDDSLTVEQARWSVLQAISVDQGEQQQHTGTFSHTSTTNTTGTTSTMELQDIKLMFKGKLLTADSQNLKDMLVPPGTDAKKTYRFLATGVSKKEVDQAERELLQQSQRNKILVRDDLSTQGKQKELARRQLGRRTLLSSAKALQEQSIARLTSNSSSGFGSIEVLPNLPDQAKARSILMTLANDPGIKACMAKHEWHVGSLAELYPEGNVGESAVCVMGLNRNKGQQILLRIRTDDLKGFRKMTSIREVLYHELAHNVHSEHDGNFFQLMRQIKKECLELDWTHGEGTTISMSATDVDGIVPDNVQGGTYTLGGNTNERLQRPTRELAARAALQRWSVEEDEVRKNCGCGHLHSTLSFLPPSNNSANESDSSA